MLGIYLTGPLAIRFPDSYLEPDVDGEVAYTPSPPTYRDRAGAGGASAGTVEVTDKFEPVSERCKNYTRRLFITARPDPVFKYFSKS